MKAITQTAPTLLVATFEHYSAEDTALSYHSVVVYTDRLAAIHDVEEACIVEEGTPDHPTAWEQDHAGGVSTWRFEQEGSWWLWTLAPLEIGRPYSNA